MAIRRGYRRGPSVSIGLGGLGSLVFPILVLGGLGYAVYWGIAEMKRRAEGDVKKAAANASLPGSRRPASNGPRPAEGERKPPPPPRAPMEEAAVEANLAVIRKEAARYRGDDAGLSRHGALAVNARNRFIDLAGDHANPPDVLEPTDRILAVDDVDLAALKPEAAGDWLRAFSERIAAGSTYRLRVQRGVADVQVYLVFPNAVDAAVGRSDGDQVAISNGMALEIQKQILSLPPDQLSTSERRDVERMLGKGECTREEFAWLQRRMASTTVTAADRSKEKSEFDRALRKLDAMLDKAPVPEALIMLDGRRFVGRLSGETAVSRMIQTVVGQITLPKEEIKHVVTSRELSDEFESRFKAGRQFRDSYLQLLTWTREWDMPVHREFVAYTLLLDDPGDRVARMAAGYYQAPNGEWVPQKSIANGAPVTRAAVTSRAEAKAALESMGFTLRGDRWLGKAHWEEGFDSLHDPGKAKISFSGTQVMPWHEQDSPKYRLLNPTGKPKDGKPPRLRFIAPTAAQGMASILIEAPGEIVECQIRAGGGVLTEAPKGCRLEVWVNPEGAKSHLLYELDQGSDSTWHDVSVPAKGRKRLTVTARITTVKDAFHGYSRFLPSVPESKDVFGVKGTVLKPSPEIDRIWATLR